MKDEAIASRSSQLGVSWQRQRLLSQSGQGSVDSGAAKKTEMDG